MCISECVRFYQYITLLILSPIIASLSVNVPCVWRCIRMLFCILGHEIKTGKAGFCANYNEECTGV